MNQHTRTHGTRTLLAATAALLVLALAAQRIQAAGPGLTGVVYALDEKGKITGTVPGASIEFKGAAVVKVVADKYGRYKVDIRKGTYRYTVTANGFKDENQGRAITTTTVPGGYQVQNFCLTRGKTDPRKKRPNVPDIAAGILQGDVVEKTADGKEVPIPEATVYLRNTNGKSPLSQVKTRTREDRGRGLQQGHYDLELAAGTYTASVVARGFANFKQVATITIVAGKTATQRFVLSRGLPPALKGQGIEGTVKFADFGKTAAARPPVKVSIVRVGNLDGLAAPFSLDDKDGFQRNLPAGRYRLVVEAKGYRTYPRTIPDVYVLRGTYAKVNVYLVPDLRFYALVYERVGRGTRPLAGASLELLKSGDPPSKARRLTTDKRGYVSMTIAREGSYVARARLAGYKLSRDVRVEIRATGENRANVELVRSGIALSLHVVEEHAGKKTPVEGAHVTLKGEKPSSGLTAADGRCKMTGLVHGEYAVEVVRKGYKLASTKVVIADTDLSREIVLTPVRKYFELTIQAKAHGKPVDGAHVVISRGKVSRSGSTGVAGSYRIRLAAGSYTVSVTHKGYKQASAPVTVSDDNVTREIVLTPVTNTFALTIRAKARGKPVEGAYVSVMHGDAKVSGTTGVAGTYTAKERAAGRYTVSVTHKGYKTASVEVIITDKNISREIVLTRDTHPFALTIHAKVGGKPMPGARVSVVHDEAEVSGTTGVAGSYTARGLAAGKYTVYVTYKGYKRASTAVVITDKNLSRDIALTPQTTSSKSFDLTIHAKAGGKAMPGALVAVAIGDERVKSGTTNASGSYTAKGLAAGKYTVSVISKGYKRAGTAVVVTDKNVSRDIALSLDTTPAKTFALTIHAKVGERSIPGARVSVIHDEAEVSGTTGVVGSYTARGLAAGKYTVYVTYKGYKRASTQVVISDRNVRRDIALTLETTVSKSFDLTIHAKAGGKAMPGALVAVAIGDERVKSGTTNASGSYTAKGLAAGKYTVSVISKGYKRASTAVVIADKNVSRDIALSLDTTPAKTFALTIRAKVGERSIPGAKVSLTQGDTVASGTTGVYGTYTAKGLAAGRYTVSVSYKGYKRASTRVTITDRNVSRDIVLAPDTPVRTTPNPGDPPRKPGPVPAKATSFSLSIVAKAGGKPLPGAEVCLMQGRKEIDVNHYTDRNGRYTVKGLKAGSYTLNMSKKGFKLHYGRPFTLAKNESVEIVLMPEGSGK